MDLLLPRQKRNGGHLGEVHADGVVELAPVQLLLGVLVELIALLLIEGLAVILGLIGPGGILGDDHALPVEKAQHVLELLGIRSFLRERRELVIGDGLAVPDELKQPLFRGFGQFHVASSRAPRSRAVSQETRPVRGGRGGHFHC